MNVYLADETHVAVIERRPSGVGTSVWVGELRTLNDQPVIAWAMQHHYLNRPLPSVGCQTAYPVSVGTSEAQVLALLVARARDIKSAA